MDRPDPRPSGRSAIRVDPTRPPDERGRWLILGLLAAILMLLGAVALSGPRATAYPALVRQNLELKEKLSQVEHRMAEVDRILERLRLYDAQLRSLTDARGGAGGPVPRDALANGGMLDYYQGLEDEVAAHGASLTEAGDLLPDGPGPVPDGLLRPAESWAGDLATRVGDFVDLFVLGEAELTALMADLETLRAIHLALPGTWPADGLLSSGFGWRRDPYGRRLAFHSGIDVAADVGEPVYVAADGVVLASDYEGAYGNMVLVEHGFGISTLYAHLSRRLVKAGDRVAAGDEIGRVGNTGRSTGPHLHFELHIDGHAQDPLKYLPR